MTIAEAVEATGYSAWIIRCAARSGKIIGTRDGRDWDLVDSSVRRFRESRRKSGANRPMAELIKRGSMA